MASVNAKFLKKRIRQGREKGNGGKKGKGTKRQDNFF